jgi:hypothetical protein
MGDVRFPALGRAASAVRPQEPDDGEWQFKTEGTLIYENEKFYWFKGDSGGVLGQQLDPFRAVNLVEGIVRRKLNAWELRLLTSKPEVMAPHTQDMWAANRRITIISRLVEDHSPHSYHLPFKSEVTAYLVRTRTAYPAAYNQGEFIGTDELYGTDGNRLNLVEIRRSDEVGLQTPLIDPIDLWGIGQILRIGFKVLLRKLTAEAERRLASKLGKDAIRELAAPSDLRFAKGTPLPKPEKPDTVYRIMSNDEAAKTLANKQLPPPIRGAEGERFVSIDSNYTALFREKQLADIEKKMGDKVARDAQAVRNIRNRITELEKSGNADGAAKLKARLKKLEAEHKQLGIANKAEADAVLKEWHAMEGQQVLVEIQLEPGTLDEIFGKSVDFTKWGPYSRSGKNVWMWKFERKYGRNIGIPEWQLKAFNKSIVKVRLHAYKQPLGKAGLPKPSGSGPN